MSDDEQVTEQDQDPSEVEAEEAFSEESEEETTDKDTEEDKSTENLQEDKEEDKPGEDKPDKEDEKTDQEDKEEAKDKEDEDSDKEDEEDAEEDLTAKGRLDKRLDDLDEEEEEAEEEEVEEEEAEDKDDPAKKEVEKAGPITKEQMGDYLGNLSDDELPGEITIGNQTVNLKEYAEQYPEEFGAIKVVAGAIAEKMVIKAIKEQPKAADNTDTIKDLQKNIAQLSFDNAVARAVDDEGNLKHPDYHKIVYGSGKADFRAWIKTQSKKIQRMMKASTPDDGVLLLEYYKEATAKGKVKAFDKKAAEKKKKSDDIHLKKKTDKSIKDREVDGQFASDSEEAEASFDED